MAPLFMFLILFTSIILDIEAYEANCPIVKCGHGAPDLRSPFRVQGRQPKHCGHPGFELKGNENHHDNEKLLGHNINLEMEDTSDTAIKGVFNELRIGLGHGDFANTLEGKRIYVDY
ncbi:hypothetical protein L1049_022687 [Liquidambar formosana]|uniref:Wall-associated receptor kinase galacturonan-binding domain-containing protein n=1 Tax=Liquidambar formosana TaxID=63359 RepID=A0AAP0WRJ9_LIQFO